MSRRMGKLTICICENKDADQLQGNPEADQRLCFATWIVHFLLFLNPKFQAYSLLLRLYSLVYVRPGQKPKLFVFSCKGSNFLTKLKVMSWFHVQIPGHSI